MNTDDPVLIQELRRDEGVKYEPYLDTMGIKTVGVGHNLIAHPIDFTYPLTDEQVDELLASDLKETFAQLDKHLPWWRNMNYPRQRACTNLCFNMGINGLLTFHNTLAAMQAGDWDAVVDGLKSSKWAQQVGSGRSNRIESLMETD